MGNKPRVGIVGLGNIAQKAYLPLLTKETNWELMGAFTPNRNKREKICRQYRIESFSSLKSLTSQCDAVFVHASTEKHFEIVSYLLSEGKDVYVDKPLAASLDEAERLAEVSDKRGRKLMVGFNRRFSPMYRQAKELSKNFAWLHMEKHRADSIGPQDFSYTMLDDYLHLVDTVRWLAGFDDLSVTEYFSKINDDGQLVFAKHSYVEKDRVFTTAMHRRAGSNLEKLEFVNEKSIIRVINLNTLQVEKDNKVSTLIPPSWETILTAKGFEGAIHHFFDSIEKDTVPATNGWEALKSQQLLHEMIVQASKNK
ncbi:Gfo/Idh/MocA family protein [Sediminibacillus albus]|uniref:Virulence factor n=1 Tax=Sediminibacillus albus TaxID=407036 RepID=A0A1G9CBB7_9BACI|nr:Gfo/Idh/MocA family oxidoreductase [Sediminibacillus albus]SDK48930.1 virulence factor [Sediminibacillus albus]